MDPARKFISPVELLLGLPAARLQNINQLEHVGIEICDGMISPPQGVLSIWATGRNSSSNQDRRAATGRIIGLMNAALHPPR